jgi:hypothetical protein
MAETGTSLGGPLQALLEADTVEPGDSISYQLAKDIYIWHPLGAKLVDSPITLAQSQKRVVSVPKGPESRLLEAFEREWEALHADRYIANVGRLARIYGIASIGILIDGMQTDSQIDYATLYKKSIAFNCFDPLNTAGSLVLNQDPASFDFQRVIAIQVSGQTYHRSRFVTIQNEAPIYIAYNVSSFGFTGRSVYQRALFPLRSFIQTMLTDDLVAYKAGVIVTKLKQPGSIIDQAMNMIGGLKRAFVKVATVGNVISVGTEESIETLNFQNLHNPFAMARKDILDNIATAADMPAILLNQETFAEGFGEGTEDAKRVAQYINQIRLWLQPLYDFFDKIAMHRAWNQDFYSSLQKEYKEYKNKSYEEAFYDWVNSFEAMWPNFIEEPESDKVLVADVKLKAIVALTEVIVPMVDPENKARFIQATMDNVNAMKDLFTTPYVLDYEEIADYVPPMEKAALEGKGGAGGGGPSVKGPSPAPPFSARDSIESSNRAVAALTDHLAKQRSDRAKAQKHRLLTFEE